MIQDTDGPDNFLGWSHSFVFLSIRGITDDQRSLGNTLLVLDSGNLSFGIKQDFINRGVQHVGSSVDGAIS